MKTIAKHQLLSGVIVALVSAFLLAGAAAPAAQAKPSCVAANTSPNKLTQKLAERSVKCLVNQERRSHGLGKLGGDSRLGRAATKHNSVMVRKGCFSHQCSGESDLASRLYKIGYLRNGLRSYAYGENIAWGSGDRGTPRSIVAAWMGSPPHRAAILSRSYKDLGVGFHSKSPGGSKGVAGTYTLDFGLRQG